jgi:succinyl-diaminopimelate desuccinylase
MDRESLLHLIESDRNSHIAFLQEVVQAPSPNPPGDTTQVASVISKFLREKNIPFATLVSKDECPNIVSEFSGAAGTGPRVAMNGHMDVFPVGNDNSGWKHGGPWSGYNDGNAIYGRGTVDMKSGTVASIIAYAYLYSLRDKLKGSLALSVVSDEETGGRHGSRWLLDTSKEQWGGDCMINAEPGGLQSVRFGEKGSLRMTFTIHTKGAHGAYTNLAEGANFMAIRLINELKSIESIRPTDLPPTVHDYLQRPEVRDTIDTIMGQGAADNVLVPTLNVGVIHGGLKVNMIPEQCVFQADIRLPIGLKAETVLDHIDTILLSFPDVSYTIQREASNPASFCDANHPLAQTMADMAEEVTGKRPVAIPGLGATDCKFWRYKGIPAFVYGVSPQSMGTENERVLIEEFLSVVKVHAITVLEYLSTR